VFSFSFLSIRSPYREDPHNENGGAWHFRVNKKDTTLVWREVLMMLIGEQFDDSISKGSLRDCTGCILSSSSVSDISFSNDQCMRFTVEDDVFGLSVGSRYSSDIFTIWNKNALVHEQSHVLERLTQVLKEVELQSPYYKGMPSSWWTFFFI
jgi:hypothetical protein